MHRGCAALGEAGGDFGAATHFDSFKKLASHVANAAREHGDVPEQEMLDAGVAPCPCCLQYFAFVGKKTSGWMHHVTSRAGASTAHAEYAAAQPAAGWEATAWHGMRASVTAGSAAHYHMNVASTASGSPPRPDELMRRTARWRENISRREAREQQEAARRGSDAAAGRGAQRLGGAAAAERGHAGQARVAAE